MRDPALQGRGHPRLQVHVTTEEYESLKSMAAQAQDPGQRADEEDSERADSVERRVGEELYSNGFEDAIWLVSWGSSNRRLLEAMRKYGLEYLIDPRCGTPFGGFVVRSDSRLADAIRKLVREQAGLMGSATRSAGLAKGLHLRLNILAPR